MEELLQFLIKYKTFFFAVMASLSGTLARYLNDKEVRKMSVQKKFGYFFTGSFIGYLAYVLANLLGHTNSIGLYCGAAGLSSGWIIKFFMEDMPAFMPDVIKKVIYKKTGVEIESKKKTNDVN